VLYRGRRTVSRDFDITLPSTGSPGIECRSGGTNNAYKLVFTGVNNLNNVGAASITSGTATVSNSAIGPGSNQYRVNLTGVRNDQYIKVTLTNVNDGTNISTIQTTMGSLGSFLVTWTEVAALMPLMFL
jgi:hypothetical protein